MLDAAATTPRRLADEGKLAVRTVAGLDMLPGEQWDRLLDAGQGALSHGHLSAWSNVQLGALRWRPIVVRRAGELVAAAPAYFYDLDLAHMAPPVVCRIVGWLRRLFPRLALIRVYELGCAVALSDPILHDGRVDPEVAAHRILSEAAAEAERGGAALIVVQDFAADDRRYASALSEAGFASLEILPTVVLDVRFSSFDEYLRAMRAQYRRRARRILRQSGALHVEHRSQFGELAPELARLAAAVFDRATEVKREMLTERYFRAASAEPRLSLLLLRRPDGSIASFALLLDDRPWLHFLSCGFEEDAGRSEGAYFRLLYEIVRTGIDGGYAHLNFGITTLPPKLDTGGVPVRLAAWMRYHRPLLHRIGALLGARMFAGTAPRPRNVFREQPV